MKRVKGPVTKCWEKCRKLMKEQKMEELEEELDRGIMLMSQHNLAGCKDNDLVEGVRNAIWMERFWIGVQNHIWPLRKNFETEWKC